MKAAKSTLRYIGFHALKDGARTLEFSLSGRDGSVKFISVETPVDLFSGPDRISIQECAGICYETLKCRFGESIDAIPNTISLTSADVVEHRKSGKSTRRNHS
jgi:hypothetical protein